MGEPCVVPQIETFDRLALGREAPQHRVDEPCRPRLADGARELDRGVDRRMRGHPGERELIEAEHGEGAHGGVARRAGRDVGQPGVQTRQMAQGAERELLERTPSRAGRAPESSRRRRLAPSERPSRSTPVRRAWATPRAERVGVAGAPAGRCRLVALRGRCVCRCAARRFRANAGVGGAPRRSLRDSAGRCRLIAFRSRSACRCAAGVPGRTPRPASFERPGAEAR